MSSVPSSAPSGQPFIESPEEQFSVSTASSFPGLPAKPIQLEHHWRDELGRRHGRWVAEFYEQHADPSLAWRYALYIHRALLARHALAEALEAIVGEVELAEDGEAPPELVLDSIKTLARAALAKAGR